MQMVNNLGLGVVCDFLRSIVLCITCHGIFCLLGCTSGEFVMVFPAVRQLTATDWTASGCASWFPCGWETGEIVPLDEYFYIAPEHEHFTELVFAADPATTCDLFTTAKAARQKLRVFRREAGPKDGESSGCILFPL